MRQKVTLLSMIGLIAGAGMPAVAQSGFVHERVRAIGSGSTAAQDRTRAVAAGQTEALGGVAVVGHAGDFMGTLLDPSGSPIGEPAASADHMGGFVEFVHADGTQSGFAYTFVNDPVNGKQGGASVVGGVGRDAGKRIIVAACICGRLVPRGCHGE